MPLTDKRNMETISLDNSYETENIWNIADSSVRPISAFHPPMNKKNVTFVKDINPSIVADRISNFLRKKSIVAEYNDELANAKCMTSNRTRFFISLFRGRSSRSNGIIVECIRLRGCARTFHLICRELLNSAKGCDSIVFNGSGPGIPTLDRCLQSKPSSTMMTPPDEASTALYGLEIAWSLLKKDRLDANVVGMESMINLTDENVTTGFETVLISARVVLGVSSKAEKKGHLDEIQEYYQFIEIHKLIVSLIRDRKLTTSDASIISDNHVEEGGHHILFDNDNDDDDSMTDYEDLEHISLMRSLSLKVFLNSLKVAEQSSFLESALCVIMSENILPSLIEEVRETFFSEETKNQALNAHDAAIAVQILRIININSAEARKHCLDLGLVDVVSKAFRVGCRRHAILEEETKKLLAL